MAFVGARLSERVAALACLKYHDNYVLQNTCCTRSWKSSQDPTPTGTWPVISLLFVHSREWPHLLA